MFKVATFILWLRTDLRLQQVYISVFITFFMFVTNLNLASCIM